MMEDSLYYLIKDLGFPFVICLLMFYQNNTTIKQNTKILKDIRDWMIYGKTVKPVKVVG